MVGIQFAVLRLNFELFILIIEELLSIASKYIWRLKSASFTKEVMMYERISPFDGFYPVLGPQEISLKMYSDSKAITIEGFYLILENVFLDPKYFNVFRYPFLIIKESQFYSWQKIPLKKTIRYLLSRNNNNVVDEAVLFDSFVGLNYFHFYNDVLPIVFDIYSRKLNYLPVFIGEELYMTKWFQYFLKTKEFSDLKWFIVGKNEYVEIRKLHLLRPRSYFLPTILSIRNLFKISEFCTKKNRLFVERSSSENRHILSASDLKSCLLKYDFTVVDLSTLLIDEQVALFRNSDVIAGVHGAGLTNIIFSTNQNLKVIEIFPSNFISSHYYWVSSILGFSYNAFLGSNLIMQDHGVLGFDVDTVRFEKFLKNILTRAT